MNDDKTDPVGMATAVLRSLVEPGLRIQESSWANKVYAALGDLAGAIQEKVQAAEQTRDELGEINRDFQNVPITERHSEESRAQLITIGENIHEVRAELREAEAHLPLNLVQVRLHCLEIVAAIEKRSKADDRFLLETLNSNPGAGE